MPWQVYNSAGQLLQATDLPDSTVTASKLATNAVTNAKVADDAIGVAELSASGTASTSTFLRGDNAWAAPSGGPSQATQSAIEAETNEDTYLPPDLVKNSPGVAKAWSRTGAWPGSGSNFTINDSYNVDSIADNGAGLFTHTWTTDFASANTYVNGGWGSEGRIVGTYSNASAAVGSSQNTSVIHEGTRTDVDPIMFVAFGDQ